MSFSLPQLPYAYDALEPHIDAKTMEIHHSKHHQAYVDKLNAALKQASEWQDKPIETILTHLDELPEAVRTAVRNNGGGHYNHSLFWESLAPNAGGMPSGELANALVQYFGSFEKFQELFDAAATGRFGSGWAWLVAHADGKLEILSTPNQDNPIMDVMTVTPLLGLDVWEHAYYLKYQNRRPEYIAAFWNLVNWEVVAVRYETVLAAKR